MNSAVFVATVLFSVIPLHAARADTPDRGFGPSTARLFHRDSAVLLGLGAVISLGLVSREDPVEIAHRLDDTRLDGGIDVGDVYGDGRTIAAGAASLMMLGQLGMTQASAPGRDLMTSFLVSGAATWALKVGVGRRRPLGGPHSFPSGHTAAAFSTLPVIYHHGGPWFGLAATALAIGTGAARMEEQRHYASDVVFGAALGLTVGRAVIGESIPWQEFWTRLTLSAKGVGVRLRF